MLGSPPPDYDALVAERDRQNAVEVRNAAEAGADWVVAKAEKFAERYGFGVEPVLTKIASDPMFAVFFRKEARRQNIHEKIAADWIAQLDSVDEFVRLPQGGRSAVYITSDGNLHTGQLPNNPGKALDFRWRSAGLTCYAAHKYHSQDGGDQGNAGLEMEALIRRFQSCNDLTCALFVIVDGGYFDGGRREDIARHARMRPPRSFAISIGELPDALMELGSRNA